ncbi:pyridoxamine 5'-phosphate oxidase [Haloprofundus marisrubri]|uniref:Pyridoxamine 5'-phosphate oxidase n=1 Tax=Haloprofundus marisrubri TaxID=1514971 RepID=A0A0W1R8K5_9EURY|nr:PPOX class F420-dependent oxidoreductase [Haloprofundus marisrubri]KTG09693.1 pyridoxamine 5'-phosphate oxidase [Haloprofundus marisrubri]
MIPTSHVDILEKESFAHIATILPDGTPQVTPVWVDHDDREAILLNTARGRRKEKNIKQNPNVSVSILDPDDPYRYISVRGEATLTEDGAVDHIDKLAKKYMGVDEYPHHGDESGPRVIIRIPADHVVTSG